ncbi:MAG: helix-turn-helix domain-containing protein, partial [Tumebacillaceae bacterium]
MSQLIAPSHTLVDNIPLGRRISEIMAEKGAAYSISAMAKRLEINRETYRLMLKGEREIYTFELEKISQDLKLSVERILQADIVEQRRELEQKSVDVIDVPNMIELAEKLHMYAIGLTEKCISLNNVGRSCYWGARYDRSLEVWQLAWPLVKECYEKYDEHTLIIRVSANLMLSYCDNNQYSKFKEIFTYISPLFEQHPDLPAVAYNSLAKFNCLQGNLEEAKKHHQLSFDFSSKTTNHLRTTKFKQNIAFVEYRLRNFDTSLQILE